MNKNKKYSVLETAMLLEISKSQAYRLVERGDIGFFFSECGRKKYITTRHIEKYLEGEIKNLQLYEKKVLETFYCICEQNPGRCYVTGDQAPIVVKKARNTFIKMVKNGIILPTLDSSKKVFYRSAFSTYTTALINNAREYKGKVLNKIS